MKRAVPLWGGFLGVKQRTLRKDQRQVSLMGVFLKRGTSRYTSSFTPYMKTGELIGVMSLPLLANFGTWYQESFQPSEKTTARFINRDINEPKANPAVILQPGGLEVDKERPISDQVGDKTHKVDDFLELSMSKDKEEILQRDPTVSQAEMESNFQPRLAIVKNNEIRPGMVDSERQGAGNLFPACPPDFKKEVNIPVIPTRGPIQKRQFADQNPKEVNIPVVPTPKSQGGLIGKRDYQRDISVFRPEAEIYTGYGSPRPSRYKGVPSWIGEAEAALKQIKELLPLLIKKTEDAREYLEPKQGIQSPERVHPETKRRKTQNIPVEKGYSDYLVRSYQGNFHLGV